MLYALPDTKKLNLTEAQAYDVIWSTFHEIQKEAFSAIVYYGQETGTGNDKSFDELGVLLPIHQFESKMREHIGVIDGLVLACRENMLKKPVQTALIFNSFEVFNMKAANNNKTDIKKIIWMSCGMNMLTDPTPPL